MEYPRHYKKSAGQAFVWMDKRLDTIRSGPMFLRRQDIAELVTACLVDGAVNGNYALGAFAVMANHVHALLLPHGEPSQLLKSLKGFTARQANKILNRTGQPFWQHESYDHWVRNSQEWERIARYIESNPVTAGLVACSEEYQWSSAHPFWRARMGSIGVRCGVISEVGGDEQSG